MYVNILKQQTPHLHQQHRTSDEALLPAPQYPGRISATMRHLQLLAVAFAAFQHVAALPSMINFPRNAPSPTLERIFPEADSLSHRDTAQPKGISQTPRLNTRQSGNSTSPAANATVEFCTEPQFQGECVNSTWPVNTCIALNG